MESNWWKHPGSTSNISVRVELFTGLVVIIIDLLLIDRENDTSERDKKIIFNGEKDCSFQA